ncbi:MAG: response regulator [Roseiflexaceae bacterium]|nr:response regulator [Roseiflexaceae bacterium]
MPVQHILIVDDEANQRLMLEQALQCPNQWVITTAANGYEALERVHERTPDLIITDYNMLGMNGLELIKQVREFGITARVILISAYSTQDIKEAALLLRVDYCLDKPVPIQLLRGLTAKAMDGMAA